MGAETLQSSQKTTVADAAAAPRSGIVWLASYPKSGNTWTRAFVHNLIHVTSGTGASPTDQRPQPIFDGERREAILRGGSRVRSNQPTSRSNRGGARPRPAACRRRRGGIDFH